MNLEVCIRALPLTLAGALALAGCGGQRHAEGAEEPGSQEVPVNVRAMRVERTSLDESLVISGALRPIHGTDVSTQETGIVSSVLVGKGNAVAEGDVVIQLERDLLEAEMRAADADRELSEYNADRTQQLFEANQVSRLEMLQIRTEHERAKARADAARIRYERAALKAPFAGLVADRYVEPGELVTAGTAAFRIVNPYTLKLEAFVSEREIAWIRKGAPAPVTLQGLNQSVAGSVHWVSFEADPMNGKFKVEVRVDNDGLELRPGVVGRARVLKRQYDEIVIPRDAIILRSETASVFVLEGDRARQRNLTLGADQGLMVVVREGLREGEQIVVRGQRELRDGSLVNVREEATALDGSTQEDPLEVRASAAAPAVPVLPLEKSSP